MCLQEGWISLGRWRVVIYNILSHFFLLSSRQILTLLIMEGSTDDADDDLQFEINPTINLLSAISSIVHGSALSMVTTLCDEIASFAFLSMTESLSWQRWCRCERKVRSSRRKLLRGGKIQFIPEIRGGEIRRALTRSKLWLIIFNLLSQYFSVNLEKSSAG